MDDALAEMWHEVLDAQSSILDGAQLGNAGSVLVRAGDEDPDLLGSRTAMLADPLTKRLGNGVLLRRVMLEAKYGLTRTSSDLEGPPKDEKVHAYRPLSLDVHAVHGFVVVGQVCFPATQHVAEFTAGSASYA